MCKHSLLIEHNLHFIMIIRVAFLTIFNDVSYKSWYPYISQSFQSSENNYNKDNINVFLSILILLKILFAGCLH